MRTLMTRRLFVPSLRIDEPERTRARGAPRPRSASQASETAALPPLDEPADLYFPRRSRGLGYRHFPTLAEALEHAREALSPSERGGCVIQIGERRLESVDVAQLLQRTQPAATL
jgi:hypothetical protein